MINPKNKLSVFYFDGSYTDYTRSAASFDRDSFDVTFATSDYIYVGFEKPVNAVYFNMNVASTIDSVMTLEYYNGTSWAEVTDFDDDSNGLTRSGFVQWDRNQEDEAATQPDPSMPEKFYYRMSTSVDSSVITMQGINLVFCDDQELKKEYNCILDESLLQGAVTHILTHEAARDDIIKYFRKRFFKKQRSTSLGGYEDLIAWDLLEIDEVKTAAKYLALHKIFFNASDSPDDTWSQKSNYYSSRYEEEMQLAQFSYDKNNDGILDDNERKADGTKLERMSR